MRLTRWEPSTSETANVLPSFITTRFWPKAACHSCKLCCWEYLAGPRRRDDGERSKGGQEVAALADKHWCGSCRRRPLSQTVGCTQGAHMEGHHCWCFLISFLFCGCVFSTALPAALPFCSGFASFVLIIGAEAMHPGRDEMAASICMGPVEAVRASLGIEAVKIIASSQTSFQNLPPAKCSPGHCCHLCQTAPIPQGPPSWLPLHWPRSPSAEGT